MSSPPPVNLRIAVFASGRGSNFQSIARAIDDGSIPNTKIVTVISNNSASGALEFARGRGIPGYHISRKQFSSDREFNEKLLEKLESHNVNFIALAGYMKKVDPSIVARYRNNIVNIHPGLLPDFGGEGMYGSFVHEAVLAKKCTVSGATVHLVNEEYDRGPVILQKTVPVLPNDTRETLAARVLEVEHELYPEAIRLFAEGRVHVDGQHVVIESVA